MFRPQMPFWGGPRPKMAAVGCYRAALRRATEPRLRVSAQSGDAPSARSTMALMLRASAAKAQHYNLASNALMPRHFPILPPYLWPSRPSLRRLVQPVLMATCARRRAPFAGSRRKDGPGRTKGSALPPILDRP